MLVARNSQEVNRSNIAYETSDIARSKPKHLNKLSSIGIARFKGLTVPVYYSMYALLSLKCSGSLWSI